MVHGSRRSLGITWSVLWIFLTKPEFWIYLVLQLYSIPWIDTTLLYHNDEPMFQQVHQSFSCVLLLLHVILVDQFFLVHCYIFGPAMNSTHVNIVIIINNLHSAMNFNWRCTLSNQSFNHNTLLKVHWWVFTTGFHFTN